MKQESRFAKKSVMVIVAAACCVAWGSAFPSIKLSYELLKITGPFEMILFAGMRFALAGAGVLVFMAIRQKSAVLPAMREMPFVLLVSFLQTFGGYILFYIGIASVTAVKSSILVSTSVFMVALLAHFMFKSDKLSWRKILGLLLGFAGVVLVNINVLGGNIFSFSLTGEGLILLSVAMGAVTVVLIRKRRKKLNTMRMNGWQLFLGGVGMVLVGIIGGAKMPAFSAASIALLAWLALLSGAAFTLWFRLLQFHNASQIEQYKFLVPVSGALLSVIMLPGEALGIEMLFAVLLVSVGTVIVNLRSGIVKNPLKRVYPTGGVCYNERTREGGAGMVKKLDIALFEVSDGGACHLGPDQHWFPKKMQGINGCGPSTAAQVMQYTAAAFPKLCAALYAYPQPPQKQDYIKHMGEVRTFVRPGLMGLTDHKYFLSAVLEFAKNRGVALRGQSISAGFSQGVAFGYIRRAIDQGYMPALMILRNPHPELDDFTWHWMAVTGYDMDAGTIFVSTYAKEFELLFEHVWHQKGSYRANCVYFFPQAHDPSAAKNL